ncbi:MAG: hypothetical protein COA79_10805 [Planctomycetota bacterium]|nr:MAG: hypothetical protein COA79_10805 [Planctomycetota bacterium]
MNVLFVMSDQHNPMFSGCYGNPITRTPNIDRLAETGVRFEYSYCSSPLCIPSRGSMFSGRYTHEIGTWCNSSPWDGKSKGWGHFFQKNKIPVCSIGRNDFKEGCDSGIETHILNRGRNSYDIHSLYRDQAALPRFSKMKQMKNTRKRDDYYNQPFNDIVITGRAIQWLKEDRPKDTQWVLNVQLFDPHPGWAPPPDLWDYYESVVKVDDLNEKYFESYDKLHPYHQAFASHHCGKFADKEDIRRAHIGYHAHCELFDRELGKLLITLENEKLMEDTLIIYTSDHGENCRAHQMWGKMNMYEDSIRVPLIISGPGIQKGVVEKSPAGLVDVFPTIAEAVGLQNDTGYRGISLLGLAQGKENAPKNKFAFSEFHANGWPEGTFAISNGKYKFVECVGERPMLFDLINDPNELHDLIIEAPSREDVKEQIKLLRSYLLEICDPEIVNKKAKQDQADIKEMLLKSGQLIKEIEARGYESNTDKLINRKDTLESVGMQNWSPDN